MDKNGTVGLQNRDSGSRSRVSVLSWKGKLVVGRELVSHNGCVSC